jgi:hypothetical protein
MLKSYGCLTISTTTRFPFLLLTSCSSTLHHHIFNWDLLLRN